MEEVYKERKRKEGSCKEQDNQSIYARKGRKECEIIKQLFFTSFN